MMDKLDRQLIFISHASPEDNSFARWISLQLIGLGYTVWCDVLKLKGAEDWWPLIENEIRNNTVKFLVVLSKEANCKDGVLKELAVAQKVKKKISDDRFIIPLHIDSQLPYDDINVELIRLNSINFKNSWADGLKNLLLLLEECKVPKSDLDYEQVNNLWQTVFLYDKHPTEQEEIYYSNWFPIVAIPKALRFHKFKYAYDKSFNIDSLTFPGAQYKQYIATFAQSSDFVSDLPKTISYNPNDSVEILIEDILSDTYDTKFISKRQLKNLVIRLLNTAFDRLWTIKPVSKYNMSNKTSLWIKKEVLEKDKFNKVLLIGKQKEKNWHFGISGNVRLFPEPSFIIYSHIWFTYDGVNLIEDESRQHAARRKQGRNWWNNDWRNKLLAFMEFLAEEDKTIQLPVGSQEVVKISCLPISFKSPVFYKDPNKENLPDDEYDSEADRDGIDESETMGQGTE